MLQVCLFIASAASQPAIPQTLVGEPGPAPFAVAPEHTAETMVDPLVLGPFEFSARGFIQNDFRVVLAKPNGNGEQQGQFIRNETQVMGRLNVVLGEKVSAVVSVRPLYTGIAKITQFNDLLDRTKVDPFWIELDDAYVEIDNLFVRGLDFKLGRQAVVWGTGDMFNPTNNLNGRDFYDPLTFGRPMSNQMALVRYQTPVDLSFTAIYIPIFRPARLPTTAPAAFAQGATVADPKDRQAIADLQSFQNSFSAFGQISNQLVLNPNVPAPTVQNGMAAFKAKGSVVGIDLSLSYLYGRWDLPTPQRAQTDLTITPATMDSPARVDTTTTIQLVYPRMHVLGADLSTSIEALGGLGVWAEAAVFFPERVDFVIETPELLRNVYPSTLPCTEARPCPVVRSAPFVKATAGLDYTFYGKVYANFQYLYGFVDEFGTDFLQHYLVGTLDIMPFGSQYTLRLAGVLNFNDRSAVAFPAFVLKPYPGLEIYTGGLIFAGAPTAKFGLPQNGSTQFFLRARFSF